MSSASRERILGRLRENMPAASGDGPSAIGITRDPAQPSGSLEEFQAKASAVAARVHLVSAPDLPETTRRILDNVGARNTVYAPGTPLAERLASLPGLLPYDRPFEALRDSLFEADAGITACHAGIAESGIIVLWPTEHEPRLLSLVPPVHIAVLSTDRIFATFAELVAAEGWETGLPTNVILVSGPSKTADIEGILVYGVHGPRELVIILVDPEH